MTADSRHGQSKWRRSVCVLGSCEQVFSAGVGHVDELPFISSSSTVWNSFTRTRASISSGLLSSARPPSLSGWKPTQPAEDFCDWWRLFQSTSAATPPPLSVSTGGRSVSHHGWTVLTSFCLSGESGWWIWASTGIIIGIIGHRVAQSHFRLWS